MRANASARRIALYPSPEPRQRPLGVLSLWFSMDLCADESIQKSLHV
jgi:hypothetical protein